MDESKLQGVADADDAKGALINLIIEKLQQEGASEGLEAQLRQTRTELESIGFNPTHMAGADTPCVDLDRSKKIKTLWSTYYDIFQAERIYGANLENASKVKELIDQIVQRDRLPTKNSLEAQQLLRSAWNTVDICVYNAARYKRLAKVSYFVQLLLGIVIIVLTVFREKIDGNTCSDEQIDGHTCELCLGNSSAASEDDSSSTGIFVTALLLTSLVSTTAFFNPSLRWRELRAASESLQSDIFQFRTRTGAFAVTVSDDRRPELELRERIQNSRTRMVQMASLTESSFTRKYPDKVWRHGQNEGQLLEGSHTFDVTKLSRDAPFDIEAIAGENPDNHYAPMKPSQYISARLVPVLDYYQSRVPVKYREWKVTAFMMIAVRATNRTVPFSVSLHHHFDCAGHEQHRSSVLSERSHQLRRAECSRRRRLGGRGRHHRLARVRRRGPQDQPLHERHRRAQKSHAVVGFTEDRRLQHPCKH